MVGSLHTRKQVNRIGINELQLCVPFVSQKKLLVLNNTRPSWNTYSSKYTAMAVIIINNNMT